MPQFDNPYSRRIESVRDLCQKRLSRFSNTIGQTPVQTMLCNSDFFYGVAYQLGDFRAVWIIGESHVTVFRRDTQIDLIQLESTDFRRAA